MSFIYHKDDMEGFNVDTGLPEKKKDEIVTLRDFLKRSPLLETYYPLYKKLWTIQNTVLEGIAVSIAADNGNNNKEKYMTDAFDKVKETMRTSPLRCSPKMMDASLASNDDVLDNDNALKFIKCFPKTGLEWTLITNYFVDEIVKAANDMEAALGGDLITAQATQFAAGGGIVGAATGASVASNNTENFECCKVTLNELQKEHDLRVSALVDKPALNPFKSTVYTINSINSRLIKGLDAKKRIDKIKGKAADGTLQDDLTINADAVSASSASSASSGSIEAYTNWINYSSFK